MSIKIQYPITFLFQLFPNTYIQNDKLHSRKPNVFNLPHLDGLRLSHLLDPLGTQRMDKNSSLQPKNWHIRQSFQRQVPFSHLFIFVGGLTNYTYRPTFAFYK